MIGCNILNMNDKKEVKRNVLTLEEIAKIIIQIQNDRSKNNIDCTVVSPSPSTSNVCTIWDSSNCVKFVKF